MLFWRYLNILSIDIALGAVAGCAFFAAILKVSLLPQAYVSLGMIVWMVYTVDHLLDASRDIETLSTDRHRFHRQHRKWLTYAVVAAALMVCMQAFFVRMPVLVSGLIVGTFVALYLSLQRCLGFAKEAAGAMLYTAGVVMAPASLSSQPLTGGQWILIILFAMTAYGNLMICSLFDHQIDLNDKHRSFATVFGREPTRRAIAFIFVAVGALVVVQSFQPGANLAAIAILCLMNFLLLVIFTNTAYFSRVERHRLFADLAFILPLLYLLFDGSQWL